MAGEHLHSLHSEGEESPVVVDLAKSSSDSDSDPDPGPGPSRIAGRPRKSSPPASDSETQLEDIHPRRRQRNQLPSGSETELDDIRLRKLPRNNGKVRDHDGN